MDLFGRSYAPGAPFYTKVLPRSSHGLLMCLSYAQMPLCRLTTPIVQVMAQLRSHTGPLTFLCVKTIDGATADVGFPAGTELPQDSRMRPATTKTDLRSPAPEALRGAALHGSGQAELQVTLPYQAIAYATPSVALSSRIPHVLKTHVGAGLMGHAWSLVISFIWLSSLLDVHAASHLCRAQCKH